MYKKVILFLGVFIFGLGIFYISVRSVTIKAHPSFAAATLKFSVSPIPTVATEATAAAQPKVEYVLAYPGILPDNPLYKLKMIRDRLWLWLTTNTVKRAGLLLLYADKRVGAGKVLIEGNQVPLGISTLVKGEKYLEQAIWEAEKAKAKEIKIDDLAKKLSRASLRHIEIVTELKGKVNDEGKNLLNDLYARLIELQKKASEL